MKFFFILLGSAALSGCVQKYTPLIKKSATNYLVVNGIILNGQDSTIISLSRTQNITDSTYVPLPETGALCTVIGEQGDSYPLTEQAGGRYVNPHLNLSYNEAYQLKIVTSAGVQYISDPIPVRQTPAIDSVNWTKDGPVINFYISTHDPADTTKYYRWQYVENWEYHAVYNSVLIYQNGVLSARPSNQSVYTCWDSLHSTDITVGTSAGLSSDVIYEHPLFTDSVMVYEYPVNIQLVLPEVAQKYSVEFSLLVNQYAITQEAFNYWTNLKQNTEGLGGIFSPEPSSQLPGNIHCVTNPSQPVIGYLTASTVQQKRIFVQYGDLFIGGTLVTPGIGCYEFKVPVDSIDYYFSYATLFTPVVAEYNIGGELSGILGAPTYCANCLFMGGTTVKPWYWPN